MQIILKEKIANLGNIGDLVNVKPGYSRNFLLPYEKALIATPANIKEFETRRADLEKAAAEKLAAAKARSEKLESLGLTVKALASDEGKLYGSIGVSEIVKAVQEAGKEVAKSEVRLPEGPIKIIGDHDIMVQLHGDVSATIKIKVVAAEEPA